MNKLIPLVFLILFFLITKIVSNGVRLSDTNIYYNLAYQIFQGNIPYKDFFYSNFPFFTYILSIYYLLVGKNIELFYFTSVLEVTVITSLIYLITYKKTRSCIVSITSSSLYILSFMVLSTSDHQTGVFTASLLTVLGYFFLQEKKILLSGIFVALSLLTKAYFLPIAFSFYLHFLLRKDFKKIYRFTTGAILASFLILLPFLLLAPKEFFSDIFGFSLTRPIGLSKINILWFFITKDFLIFILLIFNIFNIRKNVLFGLISISSIIFFFGYHDIYYLYLNFLIPLLCISFYEFYYFFKNKLNLQKTVIPSIIFVFLLINFLIYISFYRNLGRLEDFNKITKIILTEKPDFLYGVNDITPALISLTNIPALENVNDAHEYFFMKKVYNKKSLTDKAIGSKTMIITHGADYSGYDIRQDILDNIFVKETVYENCKNILSVPVLSEGYTNRINLFKCY